MSRAASLAAIILSAAVSQASGAPVKNPQTLVYAQRSDNDPIDPGWNPDVYGWNLIHNLYDPLVWYKAGSAGEFEPRLAVQVPSKANGLLSSDGTTYRFPIRKGVRFHDGSTLAPEDVRYSLLRLLFADCRTGTPLSEALLDGAERCAPDGTLAPRAYAEAARAIRADAEAVTITLKRPFAPFLALLAHSSVVLSKPWCVAHGEWDGTAEDLPRAVKRTREESYLLDHADGTGPFALERWDKAAKQIVLARHDGYWRAPARLKRVVLKSVPELATRRLMIATGDADVIDGNIVELPQLEGIAGVDVMERLQAPLRNPLLFFNFAINATANPDVGSGALDGKGIPADLFTDIEARRGFARAFDYDRYIKEVLRGRARPASGFIPPGFAGYSRQGLEFTYDPRAAEAHFRKAWGGRLWERGFTMTVLTNAGSAWRPSLVKILRDSLAAINPKFRLETRAVPWSSFLDASVQKKIPLWIMGDMPEYADTHPLAMEFLHSRGSFQRRMGYASAEADRLIESAAREIDASKREAAYRALQELARRDIPFVPVDEPEGDILRVQRTWVKGYAFNPFFPAAPAASYYYDLYKE